MAIELSEPSGQHGPAMLTLGGEVDLAAAPEVRTAILKQVGTGRSLLVQLSAVSYMDSSGVACLVEGMQAARKNGCDFALLEPSEAALEVLQLARLDQVFQLFTTLEEYQAQAASSDPGAD